MVWKNVFIYPLSGSVWNGVNIRLTTYNTNLYVNIRESRYGRVTKDGVTLNLSELDFILNQDFNLIEKNKILKFRNAHKEIGILRYNFNNDVMIKLISNKSNFTTSVTFKEDDFFRNGVHCLEYAKQLLQIKLQNFPIEDIFYTICLLVFEKLKDQAICQSCNGVERSHTCSAPGYYDQKLVDYNALAAINQMKNCGSIRSRNESINLMTELNYLNNLLGLSIEKPNNDILEQILNDILFNDNKNQIVKDNFMYKCLNFFTQ